MVNDQIFLTVQGLLVLTRIDGEEGEIFALPPPRKIIGLKTVFVRLINVSKGYILNLGPLGPLLHVKKNFHGGGCVGAAASYLV